MIANLDFKCIYSQNQKKTSWKWRKCHYYLMSLFTTNNLIIIFDYYVQFDLNQTKPKIKIKQNKTQNLIYALLYVNFLFSSFSRVTCSNSLNFTPQKWRRKNTHRNDGHRSKGEPIRIVACIKLAFFIYVNESTFYYYNIIH